MDCNINRPHSRLGWLSPATYAAARRSAALRSTDGSAPRTAIIAQQGIIMTCFPVSGPAYAGKFQFSGCVIRAAGRGMTHEEIEVHGGADCLHPAPG